LGHSGLSGSLSDEPEFRQNHAEELAMSSIRYLIFVAVLTTNALYANVPVALKSERLCGKAASTFEDAALPGCVRSMCAKAAPIDGRVCACLKDAESDEVVLSIVGYDGAIRASQPAIAMPPTLAQSSLRLEVGNYAGDGSPQLLLAVMSSFGTGMGIETWSVRRISTQSFGSPIDVADYGIMSYTTASRSSGRCRLLGSTWTVGWDPKRGEGTYIAGRWYDLGDERVATTGRQPVISHRYLRSLAKVRAVAKSRAVAAPVYWYRFADASVVVGPDPIP
jgi:hypothetical protein